MTRSPASIYNPHQAGWDEGYAAGLAAGVEAMRETVLAEMPMHWTKVEGSEAKHGAKQQFVAIREFLESLPLPTTPASGEGEDDLTVRLASLPAELELSYSVCLKKCETDLAARDAQIATLQAALENIYEIYEARSELFSNPTDLAKNLALRALAAIKQAKDSAS